MKAIKVKVYDIESAQMLYFDSYREIAKHYNYSLSQIQLAFKKRRGYLFKPTGIKGRRKLIGFVSLDNGERTPTELPDFIKNRGKYVQRLPVRAYDIASTRIIYFRSYTVTAKYYKTSLSAVQNAIGMRHKAGKLYKGKNEKRELVAILRGFNKKPKGGNV